MIWQAIRDSVRQLALMNALLSLINRVRPVRYSLVAQPEPADPPNNVRPSASPVREVSSADPVVVYFPRPPEVIAWRFETGAKCYMAEVRGRFAGYLWLAFGGYDEDEVRCRYEFDSPDVSAWDFDVYVEPEFRMGRTFVRLWQATNKDLAARGVHWSFSRISAFNPGSMASHRRMGLHVLYTATFICLGPLQLALIGAAPFVHLSLSQNSRPLLKLGLSDRP